MISVIALIFLWGFSKRITEQGSGVRGQVKRKSGVGEERGVRVSSGVGEENPLPNRSDAARKRILWQALPTIIYEVGTTDLRLDSFLTPLFP